MDKQTVLVGVDIGGTNTEVGFVDESGNVVKSTSFATNAHDVAQKFLHKLKSTIDEECARLSDRYVCRGIGIAAPNVNYLNGTIEAPANLNWGTVNLVEILGDDYEQPIRIINDANAAALGEMGFGLAQDMKNFIVITLGTGLGSGIVINGEILHGSSGMAGELGHTTVVVDGRQCGCGKTGCLEAYVSANGIRRTTIELMSQMPYDGVLATVSFDKLTAKMVSDAAHKADPLALAVLERTGSILGRKLADVVACLDPEAFILMGGVVNTGELLLEPIRRHFECHLLPVFRGKVAMLSSEMPAGRPAILGATMLLK